MPLGPFGEVVGTTGTLESLTAEALQEYKTKVIAPRNPKLIRDDDPEHKMTPSKFLFDMSMDTDQKLANTRTMRIPRKVELLDMGETSLQKFSQVNIDEPMFQPFPSEIYFQNFEPYETYEIPFVLRNNDKVPRLVKVTQANSPYFQIISPHDVGHKVGPGLPTTFKIQFMPDEKKDYTHELVCITEREKFIVPVKAIGARGILDFPDEINFPVCPIKYPNSKTLLIRNIGNKDAKFTLTVDKPFSVSPDIGVLPVKESMQVTVDFQPQQGGDHKADLVLHYDTGEDVFISLYGAAQDSNVRLDKNSIRIESTFISMANERTVTIHNRSDVIAHFHWSGYATQEEEDQHKLMRQIDLDREERTDTDRFLEECVTDPTLRDKLSILGRTFQNRKRMVSDDKLLFNDDVIKLEPVEGDIWPNSSFNVNVIFKPREAKTYTHTAFCNITGRESRLPLRIRGEGNGPQVEFSFETLNLGNIFIGSTHTYEVVLANKGDIDAIFSVMPKSTVFGPCFQFNPSEGIVMPGGHQAIQIKFRSPYLGDFQEEFQFQVDGSPEQLQITFIGSVIGPTFQFNVPKLKFGTVSYGFLNTQYCTLMNTSLVPMTFHLRVPGDGTNDSICSTSDLDLNRSELGSMVVSSPREFEIVPSTETIPPQSEIKVTVNFVSNTVKKYDVSLVVDVDNVGEEILTLPLQAKCVVPSITVLSPILDYGRCFLRHPYEHRIKLHNDMDLQAKYELVPQKDIIPLEGAPILYHSPQTKGIIPPHCVMEVPLLVEVQALEEQDIPVYIRIFGSQEPPLPVHVTCIGEGPVVHTTPLELDWNVIPVLTDVPNVVTLANESLIPAKFTAHMMRPNTVFRVSPSEGEIAPEEIIQLTVTAHLDDCVRFQDKLQINFLESQARLIPLTAYGQGTTIVSDPPLTSVLNLGPNFSNRPLNKTFKLTNCGRRHQQLVWSTDGFGPIGKAKKELAAYNPLDMKNRNKPPPTVPAMPIFKLNPNRMDLPAGETVEMHMEGFVDKPQFVSERLLCHAIIGRQGGKELVMRVDVSTDFISPLLDFSTKSVFFRVDKQSGEDMHMETKQLAMNNVSSLPLTTELTLEYPFRLVQEDGLEVTEMEVHLGVGEPYNLKIRFDPAYKDDLHIRTIDEVLHITYKEHPHVDYIALRGEVYFPNLEFEKTVVDFGCILNDTEVTRYVNITNNSPMEVKYRWSFLIGNEPCAVINRPPKPTNDIIMEENMMDVADGEEEVEGEERVHVVIDEGEARSDEEGQQETDQELIKDKQGGEPRDNREDEEDRPASPMSEEELEKGQLEQEAAPEGGVKKDDMERLDLHSRLSLRPEEEDALKSNRVLTALLERDQEAATPIGVEEVFDILPLYGTLQPGDTEQITLTFYGHADIWGQVKAICDIEGGPTYELTLKGEASLVEYTFNCRDIDYGKQMYDQVASAEITLINTGKVGFEFSSIGMDPTLAKRPYPGIPIMVPHSGYIEPLSEQKVTVKFLPGVPERFHKNFMIQVAHFEPDIINLYGEGVFPRISLDLPRLKDPDLHYELMLKEAKEGLTKGTRKLDHHASERPTSALAYMRSHRMTEHVVQHESVPSDLELQMEAERIAVRDFALELQQGSARTDLYELTPPTSNESRDTHATGDSKRNRGKKMKMKPRLPEYILDFGHVVLGTVRTHVVHATNTGWFPASFQVERDNIHHHGFHIELDRVRNLPGAPDHETVDFVVSFDPRGANLQLGQVETIVPINIVTGPQVAICLRANVTMPDMEISDDTLDFGDVRCGECKVITVQLHNQQQVPCEWNSLLSDKDRKQADRHIPMHLRRKLRQEKKKPQHYEIMPPTGMLMPGQRTNVQVKFMPTEEKFYENRIPIRISQSSQRILLLCRGQGLEPRLEFDRNLVEFGPILPHSNGDEQEIVVKNPCSFPIEFYNLECDEGYLEEEKVLRLMKGYDEYNTILLPPRNPGDKLPSELLDHYDEQMKKLEEEERIKREAEEAAEAAQREQEEREKGEHGDEEGKEHDDTEHAPVIVMTVPSRELTPREQPPKTHSDEEEKIKKDESSEERDKENTVGVGELEITPVSAAIARHLGIDLTPEGKAARNRRGISLIVHGPPMSGKSSTVVMLAKRYKAAILSVDGVVLEAISNGNTPSGLKARELCADAARRKAEEIKGLEPDDPEKTKAGGLSVEALTAHTQGTIPGTGVVGGAASMISNRKTSTISEQKGKEKHHGGSVLGAKTAVNTSSVDGATGSQVPSSPPPLAAPIARRLSVSASVAGEEGLMSCILPEELLVDLLAERMQLDDCHRGVVFDGLETLFSQNYLTTTNAILKALNNRRFIFFVTLKLDYNILKEQEKKDMEERENQARQAEEQERQRLEDMSEDEYDALTDAEKAVVDKKRLEIKKERIKKEEEMEKIRRENEALEEERRKQEEEINKPKRPRKGKDANKDKDKDKDKKGVASKAGTQPSQDRVGQKSQGGQRPHDSEHAAKTGSNTERPESHQTEKSDTQIDDKKKKAVKDGKKVDGKGKEEIPATDGENKDALKEAEILLMQRFRTFEHAQNELTHLLEFWDRTTLQIKRPPTPSEKSEEDGAQHPPSGKKGKGKDKHDKEKEKEKERQRLEKEMAEKAAKEAALAAAQADGDSQDGDHTDDPNKKVEDGVGVPNILINCADRTVHPGEKIMRGEKLPTVEEVMDGLGLGPRGPPIPPPAEFAVVPYPVKRRPPPLSEFGGRYAFIAASSDDPNIGIDEKPKDLELEEEKSVTPDKFKEDHSTPTKGKGKGGDKPKTGTSEKGRKGSADRKKPGRRNSMQVPSPPPGATTPTSEADVQSTTGEPPALTEPKTPKITIFRWVVPANSEVVLKLRFQSEELGQFDQTLNCEIVGTRRRYQLYCRGVCAFPTISREPRIVFQHRKKNKKNDEIVIKKYVLMTEIFEFGPLLVGKSRDRYKEGKYPENMEQLTVLNTSPLEADISFCFLNDSKAETYLLEPPNMVLKSGESQHLTVWAYPKAPGQYKDAIVCCVRENPEPIIFNISCDGFKPELELDKKQLHFDKVLLHRKDTKTIFLRNPTQLPVAWRLSGLENLGEDFTVAAESGVVDPLSEYSLNAFFRAMKPVQTSKKMIRMEIMDVDNIMGVVHTEPIQVLAEAYDVALDMSFPKGTDGGLDFGTIRVSEETKQTCNLKNKGKYEIAFNFVFENVDKSNPDVTSLFSVIPQKGTLSSLDRPTQVQVIFKSSKEVTVKDQPILKCQVIEPSLGEGGEIIASIPVKVSVKSVFSKYHILPMNDINFGSLLIQSKKTRQFTIENKGEFDFKYTITKLVKESPHQAGNAKNRPPVKGDKRTKSRDGSSSGRSVAKPRRAESIRQDAGTGQSRLQLGMFTIFPAFGIILPNGHQSITVDCVAENQGRSDEDISIDITERNPSDHLGGIPYKLLAEACIPAINVDDVGSIFEEHRICRNLSVWQHLNQVESGGVYGEEEKKFVFNNVIVGRRAKARFKISNTNKVPCDVVFTLKPILTKGAPKVLDIFEVEPSRTQIANHSHSYITITFTPPSMQSYSATFEASIEGSNQNKGRSLVFEVSGEGNLPRISISKPSIRNKRGQPLLLFKRILLGRTEALPFVLRNDGTLPSKVDIDLSDPEELFTLKPTGETRAIIGDFSSGDDGARKRPHTASVVVGIGEEATFDAIFKPKAAYRSQAQIRLSVIDNQYEDSVILLVGEGYEDDITLDNIHSVSGAIDPEHDEGNMAEDDVAAAKPNLIKFGLCFINEPRTLTFSMMNHSKTDCVRFQWPDQVPLTFSPKTGHLHAGCSKDIAVTFKAETPKTLTEQQVMCKVSKITFEKPMDQVPDWDDRIRTVKWVENPTTPSPADSNAKSQPPTPHQPRPAKKKIVETEPEPAFTEVADTVRSLELLVSGVSDNCKYKCKAESVHFKDTLMFQTRVYNITLSNKGQVQMDYSWQVVMDSFTPSLQRAVTFMSEGERPESRVDVIDSTYVPFSIEPQFGTIQPGKKATCTIKFSPLDVSDYEGRLVCSIPNLEKSEQGPVVGIKGRSIMPYCHFELADSDYITGAKRNPELRGPGGAPPGSTLDPSTRVMEFSCVGVGVRSIREFGIVNPTSHTYHFEWVCEDEQDPKTPSCFRCLAQKGEIRSGRKFRAGFEFVSSQTDIVESFWRFVIPDQNISVPFLLVGNTQEPDIVMDRSHLSFKSLLIGREAEEQVYLINGEDTPFSFSFVEDSCHSEGYSSHIQVQPMSGVIPAKSKVPVSLFFSPNSDKEVNFNLVCNIKKKVQPVTLNVKAEGYSMSCTLLCEDSAGNRVELSEKGLNEINFGEIEINEQAIRNLFILNSGKFNFDYKWELNERSTKKDVVTITPVSGGVLHGEKQKCMLSFCPPSRMSLRGCELALKISHGPTYPMSIVGLGVTPGLHFSFHSFNFGNCFIHRAGMPDHTTTLKLTNKDSKEISIDCLYEPTNHLHHNFEAGVVAPGQSVDVTFTFYPRETMRYHEVVTFEINGLSKQSVEFVGQGTEMKIEVADPKHKIVNLGPKYVGDVVKKYIPIVNNSPAAITFNLALTPTAPALQQPDVLSVSPTQPIRLSPRGGTCKVEIVFKPKSRIPQFTEEVMLECAGLYQPLFVVKGSCLGMEIALDTEGIPFGTVVQRSQSTRKLVMCNTGDMNAKFRWDAKRFEPDFSITPAEGYITSGMEVTFDVTFHPQEVNQDIRYDKLRCFLEGGPHKPVTLTLTGMCTGVGPSKEIQHFATHVRQKDTRSIAIANRTNQNWLLKPVIDGEFWSGPVTIAVEPQQTKSYELTYKPLTMTTENKRHTGTIFFPLPDGTGLMYNLTGAAEPPKPNGRIQRDVPCKTSYVEIMPVQNWIKRPQRFRVKTESIKPDRLDPGTTVKGMEYMDVPANSKKDYKLAFYAFREGTTTLKVTFVNEQTSEYQYYEVTFRATKPGVLSSIDLSTPVRQSVHHTVKIDNPLTYPVTFSVTCNIPEVLMPTQLQIPAQSEGRFNFEYQPLKAGDIQGRLEFNCSDLGLYMYDLNLKSTPGGPEKALYFRTCLGQTQIQMAKFLNFAKQKTDYVCKVDNPDFHVDKTLTAAPGSTGGTEVALEVMFEPSKLGEHRGIITVSSPIGGEYTFPLFGTCIPPKPQGPFLVKAGSSTPIIFRNVFGSNTPFTFQVDNEHFGLAKQGETIRAHKDHRIIVNFDPGESGPKAVMMGKLTVTCARSAGGNSSVQWVFYLKGLTP
ncbi:hydrocephalus-inducing protein homolog isoform X3 [Haliotis rufescens]|uniref:hydrocephalus-inducing protein homolog isoform X3 n=1 Tax=Haliotis rufescens TaxID=6454 RepID=UPI00201EEE26|nr:hydrocephalus-inducing protein homolog isoform X3 [Haliotis rufescens]